MPGEDRNIDTGLAKLRKEERRSRRRLQATGAWLVLAAGIAIILLFVVFYAIGPKRGTETVITAFGEVTGLGLFAIGLSRLLN